MELHRGYAAQFGISAADLERETMAPTTRGYTDFLLRVAATGDFAELASALLPCMWGFSEIGQRLADPAAPGRCPLRRLDRDVRRSGVRGILPAGAASWWTASPRTPARPARERMAAAFITSSRYELAFWEAAYTLERWPDQTPEPR